MYSDIEKLCPYCVHKQHFVPIRLKAETLLSSWRMKAVSQFVNIPALAVLLSGLDLFM